MRAAHLDSLVQGHDVVAVHGVPLAAGHEVRIEPPGSEVVDALHGEGVALLQGHLAGILVGAQHLELDPVHGDLVGLDFLLAHLLDLKHGRGNAAGQVQGEAVHAAHLDGLALQQVDVAVGFARIGDVAHHGRVGTAAKLAAPALLVEQLDIQVVTGFERGAAHEGDLVDARLDLGEAQAQARVPGGGEDARLAVPVADQPHGVAVGECRVRVCGDHLLHEEELASHLDRHLVQAVHGVELEVLGEPVGIQRKVIETRRIALDDHVVALVQVHDGGIVLLVDHHGLRAVHGELHERGGRPGLSVEGNLVGARDAVGEGNRGGTIEFHAGGAVTEGELPAGPVIGGGLDERIDGSVEVAGHRVGEFFAGGFHLVLGAGDGLQGEVLEIRAGDAHVLLLGGHAELDVLRGEHGRRDAVGNVLVERDEEASLIRTIGLRTDGRVGHDRLVELELDLQGGEGDFVLEVHGEHEVRPHQRRRVAGNCLHGALVGGEELRFLLLAGHERHGRQSHIYKLFHTISLSKLLKQRPGPEHRQSPNGRRWRRRTAARKRSRSG